MKRSPTLLLLLAVSACAATPTSPDPDTLNSYQVFNRFENAAGEPTILGVRVFLDGRLDDDSASAAAVASETLAPGGSLVAGAHTLAFVLTAQTTTGPTSYRVPRFDLVIFACPGGSLTDTGGGAETLRMPSQTRSLAAGEAITYSFFAPDCEL